MSGRRLGLASAVALVMANMIGSGVFTTSGFALADLGSREAVLWAWAAGGALALLGATCYGALAQKIPESGGEYTFVSRTLHPAAGFMAGWISLLAGFTAPTAAAALGLEAYARAAFGVELPGAWLGTAAIAFAGLMHGVRLRQGVWLQNAAVGLKVLAILGLVAFGAAHLPELRAEAGGEVGSVTPGAFAVTLVWISFAYSGWNATVYVAGELRDPERDAPRSLWLGASAVVAVYLMLNAIFVYSAPVADLAGKAEIGAAAARALGGEAFERALSAVVVLGLFTSISSMVMAGPRVYAQMAKDGVFPRVFAKGGDAPAASVTLQCGVAIVAVWISELRELLGYIGFTLSLSTAATVIGLMRLRRREGAARVPIPGYPVVPAVFVLATLGTLAFMAGREPAQSALGLATALTGIPVYLWMRRRRG